ncbi:MAG: AraC family transcriptional regulator [Clostridia bacterium]|nr:AraC family transcriptional regulator [Clostridia bacterium]
MNYINELKKAIDYIEDNLDKDINFEIVAKEVGMSAFYFHKIFSAIIGISPTSYIRNRRLTLAAQEISKNNDNILDIALKYGFESHEAFSRAFKNFHGIVPKLAKVNGNELKNYSKVDIDCEFDSINPNKVLNYRIEERDNFVVIALFRNFNLDKKNEIPEFWKEIKENRTLQKISDNYSKNTLGICIGTQNVFEYQYGIGREIEETEDVDGIKSELGMKIVEVSKCSWVVFKCEGQDEKDINELWTRIYKEFFIMTSYKQCMDIDFELYDDKDTEIWIPISKE